MKLEKLSAVTGSLYTDEQYAKFSSKLQALTTSLIGIVMLFFMAKPDKLKGKDGLITAAGVSGVLYGIFSSIDAYFRILLPMIRIFDEISITASFISLWLLLFIIFDIAAPISFVAVVAIMTMFGIPFFVMYDMVGFEKKVEKERRAQEFITMLSTSADPASAQALTTVALFALLMKPDDPMTANLIQVATAKIKR